MKTILFLYNDPVNGLRVCNRSDWRTGRTNSVFLKNKHVFLKFFIVRFFGNLWNRVAAAADTYDTSVRPCFWINA